MSNAWAYLFDAVIATTLGATAAILSLLLYESRQHASMMQSEDSSETTHRTLSNDLIQTTVHVRHGEGVVLHRTMDWYRWPNNRGRGRVAMEGWRRVNGIWVGGQLDALARDIT